MRNSSELTLPATAKRTFQVYVWGDAAASADWVSTPDVTIANKSVAGDGSYVKSLVGPFSAGSYALKATITTVEGQVIPFTFNVLVV